MGPSSQRFKQWASPFRRGSSPCSASAPSSWSLRWIRPERTTACFPAAEAGGPLPSGSPRASGRSLSGRRRCRLGQVGRIQPEGPARGSGVSSWPGPAMPASPGCHRHRWTSPNTARPRWRRAPVLQRCARGARSVPPVTSGGQKTGCASRGFHVWSTDELTVPADMGLAHPLNLRDGSRSVREFQGL